MSEIEKLHKIVKEICKNEGVDFVFMTENDAISCSISKDEVLRKKWNLIK